MENIGNSPSPYYRNKLGIVIAVAALFIITAPAASILGESNPVNQIVSIVTMIALNLLAFAWCYYDSLERNESFGRGWGILILLLGFLALVIYLFKSRGFKRGLISTGKALLIFLGIVIGSSLAIFITDFTKETSYGS